MTRQRDYDSTVARIAGNIFSGLAQTAFDTPTVKDEERVLAWCVEKARFIVAETKRTEPRLPVQDAFP